MKKRRAAPKDKKAAGQRKGEDDSTDTKMARDANKCIVSDV